MRGFLFSLVALIVVAFMPSQADASLRTKSVERLAPILSALPWNWGRSVTISKAAKPKCRCRRSGRCGTAVFNQSR